MSWGWRTKPRSIIRTVEWFPCFATLEGQNWNQENGRVSRKDGNPIHPVRRAYIYSAHGEDDPWLSTISYQDYLEGQQDIKETESNGRNDKTTFEFLGLGYVDKKGLIRVNEVGSKIVNGTFDQEDYLKQLLKMRLPNYTYESGRMKLGKYVFPFQLILEAFGRFESLNRSELALLFGCEDTSRIPAALDAIGAFKEGYEALENKNSRKEVEALFSSVFLRYYGGSKLPNQAASFYDYAEGLARTLIYTGLFSASGRSIATKIRVAEHSRLKVQMLRDKYEFFWPEELNSLDAYMAWYGSSHNVILPWENAKERSAIIENKAELLLEKLETASREYEQRAPISREEIRRLLEKAKNTSDNEDLKELEHTLSNAITSHNEEYFIRVQSKTSEERAAIMEKFKDILANDDMSALWLEVNTWKSLIAVEGDQVVKRNFKIEDDLTPKSFAPGVGNTPDMELYKNGYIIIPEVSLMTGVRQWEHEASSVVEHVLRFIRQYEKKRVLGLFLSSSINVRTLWQFFLLSRESWMGQPVPVVPMTISQYMEVIGHIYKKNWKIDQLYQLLEVISRGSLQCRNFEVWKDYIGESIVQWKAQAL
mgnify:CR=1 FL=1